MEQVMKLAWLVEWRGSELPNHDGVPYPIYATDMGYPTCNPWQAKHFETKEAAEIWMHRPEIIGYDAPWEATEHGFSY